MDKDQLANSTNNTLNDTTTAPNMELPSAEVVAITVFYLLLALTILIGNGLILSSFAVNRRIRTTTNTLVMGLAVSDLLVCMVSIPCWIYVYLGFSADDHVGYQFYITSDIFIGIASILQLTSISIERCHAVVRPFRHRTLSPRFFRALLLVPWLYAGFMAGLQPVQYENWKGVYTLLMTTTCFLLPVVIIIVAYGSIYWFARRSKTSVKLTRHRARKKCSRKELRLSLTLAVITCLFVIAWLPLFGVTLIATYFPATLPSPLGTDRLLKFVKFCHYSNSAVNPFLYTFRNSEMRETFRHLFHKFTCRSKVPVIGFSKMAFQMNFSQSQANRLGRNQGSLSSTVVWRSSV